MSPVRALPFAFSVLHIAAAACGRANAAPVIKTADLLVTVRTGTVSAPDSVGAGWTRVRVEEDGKGHILVVFRMSPTTPDADVAVFLAALDTGRATPAPALALGGPEIGDTGEVVMQLTPGRYVLGCVARGRDGHRHASAGEAKTMVVREASPASPQEAAPHGTQNVPMVDFAYVVPERWKAGANLLRVENGGRQDHQLRLLRLRAGATLRDWLDNPDKHAVPVAGVARLGPGAVVYLSVELRPGGYILLCLIPDVNSGRPHVELGMLRAIQVE